MLPERLAFALSMLTTITLVYIGMNHQWDWTTVVVAILLGIFVSIVIGRLAGLLSARELTRMEVSQQDSDSAAKGPGV